MAILLGCSCAWAQEKEIKSCISVRNSFEDCRNPFTLNYKEIEELSAQDIEPALIAVTPATESQQKKSRLHRAKLKTNGM